jgi:hypothetical protein
LMTSRASESFVTWNACASGENENVNDEIANASDENANENASDANANETDGSASAVVESVSASDHSVDVFGKAKFRWANESGNVSAVEQEC